MGKCFTYDEFENFYKTKGRMKKQNLKFLCMENNPDQDLNSRFLLSNTIILDSIYTLSWTPAKKPEISA